MNRRGFLGSLAAFAAQCTLDPELALWKPGAKTISVPKPVSFGGFGYWPQKAFEDHYVQPFLNELDRQYRTGKIIYNGFPFYTDQIVTTIQA